MNKKIIIVDDEKRIRDLIRAYLEKEGYSVMDYDNADSAYAAFLNSQCDMLVIDIMMPGTNGLDLCKKIRAKSSVPIIIVSARDEEIDRILGLELGSDDYLAKPFSPRELVIRMKNIFKRIDKGEVDENIEIHTFEGVEVNVFFHSVTVNGQEASFTEKEYELLLLFVSNPLRAFSREQLIDRIWGYEYIGDVRPVDDLVKRIRKKLRSYGSDMEISTVWGYGYKASGGTDEA
ncbi:MAG: response regulator transcription factor [Clostridia bacterium]|nr:response regulator transcription factor [Clostridia bacterium]MBN2883390.1 response regulator transcription factor [Clostridia bacterium]